jgi:hypothetical protein
MGGLLSNREYSTTLVYPSLDRRAITEPGTLVNVFCRSWEGRSSEVASARESEEINRLNLRESPHPKDPVLPLDSNDLLKFCFSAQFTALLSRRFLATCCNDHPDDHKAGDQEANTCAHPKRVQHGKQEYEEERSPP